jgi:FkbM family methyltransferase
MIENIINSGFGEIQRFSVNCTLLEITRMQNKSFGKNILHGIQTRFTKAFRNPYRRLGISRFRLIYYKHLAPGKLRVHRIFGKELSFLSATELLHGFKEIFLDEIYKQDLPPKPFIVDCGANIGLSVIYMKRLYPDAEVIAFEPDEQNFKLLEKNIQSFALNSVTLKKEAVWVEDTVLKFANEGSMSSKIDTDIHHPTINVNAIRLKSYLARKVDFLKIDIEGAEYTVLRDIKDNLHLVNNLFVEYHGTFQQQNELDEIMSIIRAGGFTYYIKEAAEVYKTPFLRIRNPLIPYDLQLNIFCFRQPN